jgi:hypothetical protein
MTDRDKLDELARLRNRHVAKLLSFLGDTPPYLETAVKKAFSMFAEDVEANIINSDQGGSESHEQRTARV